MRIASCLLEMMKLGAIGRGEAWSLRPSEGVLLDRSSHPIISVAIPNSHLGQQSPNRAGTGKPEGVDMKQPIYVGVDVSKKQLDVAIRPLGQVFGVSNDRRGISQLVKRLKKLQPVCIAIDATGGLEKELAYALAAGNLPVAVVNPRQVSNFAKSTGQRAKTDAIDAAVLAHFAEVMKPEVRPLMPDRRVGRPEPLSRRRCARQLRRCGAASAA